MLVTNNTSHTYVLNTASPSVVVIVEASAVDQLVSDDLYVNDSVFNERFDKMVADGILTVTDQPDDPSPVSSGGGLSPLVLTANSSAETPLKVSNVEHDDEDNANTFEVWADPQNEHGVERLVAVDGSGNLHIYQNVSLLGHEWLDENSGVGNTGYTLGGIGFLHLTSLRTNNIPLQIRAADGQTANLLEAYDENSALVFTIHSDGLIETNDAGLSVDHNGGIDAGFLILQPSNAAYDILSVQGRSGQTGKLVQVKDANGATVFRVDPDGTIHAKTGGSIHFDL